MAWRSKSELIEELEIAKDQLSITEKALGVVNDELEAARKAVFMPPGYPGGLAVFLAKEVWPSPRSEDIQKIQLLKGQVDNLTMLVKRLMRYLPDCSPKEQAANYLKAHGLEGSILR